MTHIKYKHVSVEYPMFHHFDTTTPQTLASRGKPQASGRFPYEVWLHGAIVKES